MADLGTLGGETSWATGINSLGEVVGFSTTSSGVTAPFIWDQVHGMRRLSGPVFAGGSYAAGVNASAQVVGYFVGSDSRGGSFLWSTARKFQSLASLISPKNPYPTGAFAINRRAQIAA